MWKILIVDDEPEMRELVAQALMTELSCRVTQAQSAKEASALLLKEQFHIIVSDLCMEDNGLDILRFLRQQQKPIPIVYFSGTEVDLPRADGTPYFVALVAKPNFEKLLTCIQTRLGGAE